MEMGNATFLQLNRYREFVYLIRLAICVSDIAFGLELSRIEGTRRLTYCIAVVMPRYVDVMSKAIEYIKTTIRTS